jgi:hypothetical protein
VLGAIAFGPHVRHGGFIADDWTNLAVYRYGSHHGGLGAVADYHRQDLPSANHAAQPVLFAVEYGLLGGHMHLHLMLAIALGALMSLALYAVMRTLRAPPWLGVMLALLAFVYPLSDANRLWPAAGWNNFAVACYFAGAVLALRGTRSRALLQHAGAFVLFVIAIMTYELTVPAVALTAVLYLRRTSLRGAAARWAADIAAAVTGVLLVEAITPRAPLGTTAEKLHHAGVIARESLSVWADTLWPFGGLGRVGGLIVLALLVGLVAWRAPRRLPLAALALLFVVLGYAALVPGEDFYTPLYPGLGNRVNLMAGIGMIALILVLVASLARDSPLVIGALSFVLVIGYVHDLRGHADAYDSSYAIQARQLHQLKALVPQPPPGTTVYVRQRTPQTAPGIPTFNWRWDLSGATKLLWHDGSDSGYPILRGTRVVCAPDLVYPDGNGLAANFGAPYGHAILVDLERGQALGLDTRSECRHATMSGSTAR